MPGRDIFLSYSSRDEAIVELTLEKLEAAGHRCWFAPRDIPVGEFYAGQIIQALRESRFVLLFFSFHSNTSEQVVREINFAVSQRLQCSSSGSTRRPSVMILSTSSASASGWM